MGHGAFVKTAGLGDNLLGEVAALRRLDVAPRTTLGGG